MIQLQQPPLSNVVAVLSHKSLPQSRGFIGPGQLDIVVCLAVNVGFIGVVSQKGFLSNDHVGNHVPCLLERYTVAVIIKHKDFSGVQKRPLHGFSDDIQTAFVLLDVAGQRIPGVVDLSHVHLQISGNLLDDLPGSHVIERIGSICLEIPQPVITGYFDYAPSVFFLREHPSIKLELTIYGKAHNVALQKSDVS